MEKCFNGLTVCNVELTSRCNKNCWMCGRRKIERDYPHLAKWGEMPFEMVELIAKQLPPNILVTLHNNGEPTMYPKLNDALKLFNKQTRHFGTNAKLLVKKADQLIDNMELLTISVIQDDPEGDEQYEIVKQFLDLKGNKKPYLTYRLLGHINKKERWEKLPGLTTSRTIHSPMGSFKYRKQPTKPEYGVCLDLLSHLVIDRYGAVSPCVRFDPYRLGVIGDVNETPLVDIWNGPERKEWLDLHLQHKRDQVSLCKTCKFWGVARSD